MLFPVAALLASSALVASPQSTVVVLTSPTGPSGTGFVDALRIQMAGTGRVESGPAIRGDTRADQIANATEEAARFNARVVVWIDEGMAQEGEREYILNVVGAREGQWNLEVFRIWARAGPGLDRTLALKVRAVLDRLLEQLDERPPPKRVKRAPPPPAPQNRLAMEAGVRGNLGDGTPRAQAAGLLGIVFARDAGRHRIELAAVASYDPGRVTRRGASGTIDTFELVGDLSARASVDRGRFRLGAHLGARLRVIEAVGTTMMGGTEETMLFLPSLVAGPEVRVELGARLHVRLALGAEVLLQRRRLNVSQIKVVDFGRFRGEGLIALLFVLP